MVDSLLDDQIHTGMSQEEVLTLLGPPDHKRAERDTLQNWMYSLGYEGHGFGWKFHQLEVLFHKDSIVSIEHSTFID